MKINVRTHHVDITDSLKEYARKKAERLEKFFENIQEIVLELNISDHPDADSQQIAMGTVWASGTILRASEASRDMYASIDLVTDKLETQLKKHKEKLKDHKKDGHKRSLTASPDNNSSPRRFTRSKKNKLYIPKPMDVEDAAIILEENKSPFLVFRNAKTEQINVIYPTDNDEFSVIEP